MNPLPFFPPALPHTDISIDLPLWVAIVAGVWVCAIFGCIVLWGISGDESPLFGAVVLFVGFVIAVIIYEIVVSCLPVQTCDWCNP